MILRGLLPLITVDRKATQPLYRQIYDAWRAKIERGELRAGQAVPSTRDLASALRISRIPVLNAYAQLLAEGYFEARIGAGTFVSPSLRSTKSLGAAAALSVEAGSRPLSKRALAVPAYERAPWVRGCGAFKVGEPALEEFPFRIWSKLVARYARSLHVSALRYGDPMGLPELREAVAVYLRAARGVRCEPEQIMIVSGSQHALDIATRVLMDPGASAWVEEPGYWLVHDILKATGCRAIPVPVDEEGLDVAAGVKLCRKARAAFVAPSHQYPLGVTMSARRRFQLLEWAQQAGSWIIEDDYDSEYRYDSMPIASLQGLDSHARVIYIGTFSKVMFPSLRLGYLIIPADLLERFTAIRHAMDLSPSHTCQAILAEFIREGHFSRHVRKMRQLYAERRSVLVQAIGSELGSTLETVGAQAGMHLTVMLARWREDREVSVRAARKKLWLWPLSPLYVGPKRRAGFVLGFGNTTSSQIPEAVRQLGTFLKA